MWSARSVIKNIAGVAAFTGVFLLARYQATGEFIEFGGEPFSVTMERDAARINATLPEMVSEGVRLDRAAAGPGNAFNYIYTIVDDGDAKKISSDQREFDKLKAQLRERVCTVMPAYRDNETIVTYSLRDAAGGIVADISINPKDC